MVSDQSQGKQSKGEGKVDVAFVVEVDDYSGWY